MTGHRMARVLLGLFFTALLATPLVMKQMSPPQAVAGSTPEAKAAALTRHGFHLDEAAHAAGIDFVHRACARSPIGPDHARGRVASAAASIVDFDHDGRPDIYVTSSCEGCKNALYRNLGDGTFRDVAGDLGIADVNQPGTGVSMGAVWGDYDNDGYEDLLLIKWGRPELFHNDHGRGFTRVSEQAGLPPWIDVNTAIWFDYDGDGLLDMFIAGYYSEDIDLWHLTTTRIMPESFEYAKNGGRRYLFHNLGNGKFEEVSAKLGIDSRRWALAAAAADLRGTGRPDLFVANDYKSPSFTSMTGPGSVKSVKDGSGLCAQSGMNVAFGYTLNRPLCRIRFNISEDGILIRKQPWCRRKERSVRALQMRKPRGDFGVELGVEFWGAVRRFEYRWHARPALRTATSRSTKSELLVRFFESGRRKVRSLAMPRTGQRSKAAVWPATSQSASGSMTAPADLSMWPRRSESRTPMTDAPSPWRTCGIAECWTLSWPTRMGPCWCTRTR
jgi:hypothetical protein